MTELIGSNDCAICMGRRRVAVGLSFPPHQTIGFKVEYDPCPGCTPPPHTFQAKRTAQILRETREIAMTDEKMNAVASGALVPATKAEALDEDGFMDAVWDALKADANDLRKQQRILRAFRVAQDALAGAVLAEAAAVCVPEERSSLNSQTEFEAGVRHAKWNCNVKIAALRPEAHAALARALQKAREVKPRLNGVYVASKAKYGPEWIKARQSGYPIISTWIDQSGVGETSDWPALWDACISEASSCRALVLVCRPGDILKGAWSEVGAALANGVPVFAVGIEDFSIRHHPGLTLCATEDEAFSAAALQPGDGQ